MQKIITPGGETLVLLPLQEYEDLIDLTDIATARRKIDDIAAGRDELVPSEILSQLLAGRNPVRVWREYRGLSASALAAGTDLSAPYISEIETGKKEGSLSSLKRIAAALSVDVDDLI